MNCLVPSCLQDIDSRLCEKYSIQRMFLDECHQAATERKFRNQWVAIHNMIIRNTWQIIHLTATLPICLQQKWETLLGIDRSRTIFLRGPTNRIELAYNVVHVNPKTHHIESVVKQLIRMLEDNNQHPDGRRIMFVASIPECDNLAKSFNCYKHHGGMSDEEKKDNMAGWKSGLIQNMDRTVRRETWIVATPGLITGYDYHRVEDVLFYEMGYGLLNLVQGGGRGGRSGQKANVIVITSDRISEFHTGLKEDDDVELMGLMVKWTHNVTECRRVIISDAMDGMKVTCQDLAGAERCDICKPDSKTAEMIEMAVMNSDKPRGAIMPMEDIQDVIGRNAEVGKKGGKEWDDDMDDMEFEGDDLILSLDLSTIKTPAPTKSLPSTSTLECSTHKNWGLVLAT